MKLFLGTNCPQCEALKRRIDLSRVPWLEVYTIPSSGVPSDDMEAKALAEADHHDIYTVPALVIGPPGHDRVVLDLFEIADRLQAAIERGDER